MAPLTMAQGNVAGLLAPGNIDLAKRPIVKNADGSISTVRSMSFGEDGREILIPTVSPDGRILDENQAIDLYHKTGQHLGMFDNPNDATNYANSLHSQQEAMYAQPQRQPKQVTLTIEGRRVKVDDAFLSLTPEQQAQTVDEIAAQIGIQPGQQQAEPAPQRPPSRHLSYEEGAALLDTQGPAGQAMSGVTGFLNGIPIVGGMLDSLAMKGGAAASSALYGQNYDEALKQNQLIHDAARENYPKTNTVGEVAGAVIPMVAAGATATGARLMGMAPGQSLGTRVLASGLSNSAVSAADTAARGGSKENVAGNGLISGAVGAAFPLAGAAVRGVTGAVGSRIAPLVNSITNPAYEAARRVGSAVSRDAAANPAGVFSAADEAAAIRAGVPVVNADRGGEVTRALSRSVANQNPEARQAIENVASDRFGTQAPRAIGVIRRVMGGNVDDIAHQESIRTAAERANAPAYNAAYRAPAAQQVYTPRLQQLMQSPTFRDAVSQVPSKSADRGALTGQKAIGNPFAQNSQGQWVLRKRADGTLIAPTLEFWDHVQRNLRPLADRAAAAGDKTTATEIGNLRRALNGELDNLVPEFGRARQGAAAFFGAEDALEAGKKFANQPRSIPEATKAMRRFTPADRKAFATGYASELIDKIKTSPDRANVINSVFGNQASRESVELALGPQRAREVEAYVRVEGLVDRLRGAMGNSTTARQLAEMGLGATGGYYATGDIQGAGLGAALMAGGRFVGQRAQSNVMQRMGQMLTSDNPAHIKAAVQLASRSPAYMETLAKIEKLVAAPARGLALEGSRN